MHEECNCCGRLIEIKKSCIQCYSPEAIILDDLRDQMNNDSSLWHLSDQEFEDVLISKLASSKEFASLERYLERREECEDPCLSQMLRLEKALQVASKVPNVPFVKNLLDYPKYNDILIGCLPDHTDRDALTNSIASTPSDAVVGIILDSGKIALESSHARLGKITKRVREIKDEQVSKRLKGVVAGIHKEAFEHSLPPNDNEYTLCECNCDPEACQTFEKSLLQ